MLIGSFDTGPFVELATLAKIPTNRNKRALEAQCQACMLQFDAIGKELPAFAQTVENDRVLFDFLARAMRDTKRTFFKFATAAQLYSEVMSIRNVIKKIRNGSGKVDYDLLLSFGDAVQAIVDSKVCEAA